MEILERRTYITRIEETVVNHPTEGPLTVKDYYDSESDKIVDSIIQSKDGYTLEDPTLVEQIYDFLDNN